MEKYSARTMSRVFHMYFTFRIHYQDSHNFFIWKIFYRLYFGKHARSRFKNKVIYSNTSPSIDKPIAWVENCGNNWETTKLESMKDLMRKKVNANIASTEKKRNQPVYTK